MESRKMELSLEELEQVNGEFGIINAASFILGHFFGPSTDNKNTVTQRGKTFLGTQLTAIRNRYSNLKEIALNIFPRP